MYCKLDIFTGLQLCYNTSIEIEEELHMSTKFLVYTALMTAVIAVLGMVPPIPLAFIPVPIVLQNLGIFLAAVLLGRKYGTLSVIVFLLLVAAGMPLLSGGRGGIGVFQGPSVGFLIMYPVCAYLIGLIRDMFLTRINFLVLLITILLFRVVLLDLVGAIVMGIITHIPVGKAIYLSLTFMPGDIIKAILAALIGNILLNHSRFQQLIKRQ